MKKPIHVFLIDDDPNAAFFTKRALRKVDPDAQFTFFEDSRAALTRLQELRASDAEALPDLILLDLNMPTLSGWEFLKEAQTPDILNDAGVRLCIVSSSINPDDINRAERNKSVHAYLQKHLNADQLREALS